jgi:hypothetical protein
MWSPVLTDYGPAGAKATNPSLPVDSNNRLCWSGWISFLKQKQRAVASAFLKAD